MTWQHEFFSEKEMTCKCGCGFLPSDEFMSKLVVVRKVLGFPLIVSSGGRCPEYNKKVSSTGLDGPHTVGAADIKIYGEKAFLLIKIASIHGMTGIGVKQKGDRASRFIHLDSLRSDAKHPRPWIWSY